jgi:signal transduction histidine kinase
MRGGAPIGVPTARGSANVVSAMSGVLAPAARPARLPVLAGFARGRYAFAVGALAVVYYGAAQLGYALEVAGPVAAVVWLPVGVGIAALYLGGLALWPGVLIGDLLANDYTALPLGSALGQTFGNVLEVLVAVLLLRRLVRSGSPLETVGGVVGMVAAIAAGTAVSATVGSLAQWFGGVIEAGALPTVWRTWWLGDITGALVLVPLAIAWSRRPAGQLPHRRRAEAVLVLVAVVALTEIATTTNRPLSYVVFPAFIWAALRFGARGATAAVAVAVGITAWNAAHYLGAFVFHSVSHTVINTQLFIGVAALTTLALAAVVSEREAYGEGLQASRARLVDASQTERRRLLRNLHDGAQQRLTALAVHLRLAAEAEPPTGAQVPVFDRAWRELAVAVEELRELAHGLHPMLLANHGLAPALEGVAACAAVPVVLVELPVGRFDVNVESTAYYVVAEAVANAQKHAAATSVRVRVVLRDASLRVEISDDGVGGASEARGSGLQGLRDRVEAVGGRFAVDSGAGGTRITALIPAASPS